MDNQEQVKRLAMTYYMIFLYSGIKHYETEAYRVGMIYKRMKAMELKPLRLVA